MLCLFKRGEKEKKEEEEFCYEDSVLRRGGHSCLFKKGGRFSDLISLF